ncbi:hypothetical protein [Deinococcus misasensis]|uniref:hypothetical protein n=1 Tax=Deinococcus misasensis TaxID=392413 RepID=UPI000550A02E|nr:hypothetical protein [Deinococcus misasensis]
MDFAQNTADFLAGEVKHIIQDDSNYEVSSHLTGEHLELLVRNGQKGVNLRFARGFIEQSDRIAALEALDQHIRYAIQEGLFADSEGNYPSMDIPAVH